MISVFCRASRLSCLLGIVALGSVAAYPFQQSGRGASKALAVGRAQVTAVRYSVTAEHIRIVVQFDNTVTYQPGTAVNPDRIFFDLFSTEPAVTLRTNTSVGDSVLQRIRIAEYQPGIARLVLDVSKPVPYTTSFIADPPRLVIELARGGGKDVMPSAATAGTSKATAPPSVLMPHVAELHTSPAQPWPATKVAADRALPSVTATGPENAAGGVRPTQTVTSAASVPKLPPTSKPRTNDSAVVSNTSGASAVSSRSSPSSPHNAGNTPADTHLAVQVAGSPKLVTDPAANARKCLKAAQEGSIEAQFQLGNLYMKGSGVPQDRTEAARWYTHAAQQGHAAAASNLGLLYANGWGVGKNDEEAVKWFRKAADAGDDAGRANLGAMYLKGRGVTQSDVEGAKWLRTAAERGIPEAQYGLGTLFANGRGVSRSEAEAAKWLLKAADQGYAPAQLAVGKLQLAGSGVPRDYRQAMNRFQQADIPEAWFQIGQLYRHGLGVPRNDSEAISWFLRAARQKLPEAQYAMGQSYQNRDPVEAYAWFALAASNGYEPGLIAMNSLAPSMTSTQLREAQGRALHKAARTSN